MDVIRKFRAWGREPVTKPFLIWLFFFAGLGMFLINLFLGP